MYYQRLFKWVFIISCLLMAVTYYYKDNLPNPNAYDPGLLKAPLQSETARTPFSIVANKQQYTITPKFDYELTGIVVSYSDADGFTNIWHHKRWKDFINVRDICVIWEPNVSSGIYKNMQFSSDSWTCWVYWPDAKTGNLFQSNALSNNHLLTDNYLIKNALRQAEIGDVIHFKGVLAEYKNNLNGGFRGTSTTRDDTGDRACETVYIDEFNIVKKANPELRTIYAFSKWIAGLSLIGFLYLFCTSGHRPYSS